MVYATRHFSSATAELQKPAPGLLDLTTLRSLLATECVYKGIIICSPVLASYDSIIE